MSLSLLFAPLDTISEDSTSITIGHSFRKPMPQQHQTGISVSAAIRSLPSFPASQGSSAALQAEAAATRSAAVGNACVTQGRCSQGFNCQPSLSGSHFLPSPWPHQGQAQRNFTQKSNLLSQSFSRFAQQLF